MSRADTRRICWPNPDATCLEGGCGYCRDHRPRSVRTIRRYAREVGQIHHRCAVGPFDALAAFDYGERHGAGR